MPLKSGTLQFLQDANTEAFAALLTALIGPTYNPSTVYILYGIQLANWVTPNFSCAAGAAFYGGEIYLIDATVFSITGVDVPVFSLGITQYTTDADPVTFTDSSVHNVHNIRKLVISAGATGSGIADFSSAKFLSFYIPAPVTLTEAGAITITGTYPNFTISSPSVGILNPVLGAGSVNVGDVSSGAGTSINVTFDVPLTTSNYYVLGTVISNGNQVVDVSVGWGVTARTTTGFTVHFQEFNGSSAQNIALEWIVFAK